MLIELANTPKPNGKPYARASLESHWKTARTMLRDLAAEYDIPDPTRRCKLPRSAGAARTREQRTLSARQVGVLIDAVKTHRPQWTAEVVTLVYGGLRPCELYALEWTDIDRERSVLRVSKSAARGQVNATKTGDPRDVVVTAVVIQELDDHRREMMRRQARGLDSGLVFPSTRGTHRTSAAVRNMLKSLSVSIELGVIVTPLVLRRTFNTLMLEQGIDRLVLRSQIGHTSEAMTSRYAGIRYDQKQAAAEAMARLIDPEP